MVDDGPPNSNSPESGAGVVVGENGRRWGGVGEATIVMSGKRRVAGLGGVYEPLQFLLRWQKDGAQPNADGEIVLLLIGDDERVEAELRHGDIQQVGGFHREPRAWTAEDLARW